MQHFDILAFHHSLQPFFTSFTFQVSYPSDLFHVYFLTNFTSSTFTFWPLWSIWPLPLSFDHFQNPPSLDKVKGSILTCVIIFQKCLFQAALIFCHSETFIENLGNYKTYCMKAPTGMMMMVKTKWLQLSTKENEFELWFLAQGDCLQRSWGESRIEPPSFHHPGAFVFCYHFIVYYHYLFIMTKYLVVKASKHSPLRSILI